MRELGTYLCINCRYCNKTSQDSALWKCTHNAEISLVDGLSKTKYCKIERSNSGDYLCGPEGRFFDPAI